MKEQLKFILIAGGITFISIALIIGSMISVGRRLKKEEASRAKEIDATLFDSGSGTITTVTHDGHKLIVANCAYRSVSIIHHPDCCK